MPWPTGERNSPGSPIAKSRRLQPGASSENIGNEHGSVGIPPREMRKNLCRRCSLWMLTQRLEKLRFLSQISGTPPEACKVRFSAVAAESEKAQRREGKRIGPSKPDRIKQRSGIPNGQSTTGSVGPEANE